MLNIKSYYLVGVSNEDVECFVDVFVLENYESRYYDREYYNF